MRLVVGIAQILVGLGVLALNLFSIFQTRQYVQLTDGPEHDVYSVTVGWEYYALYIGIPIIILLGGWLLIRDHRLLAKAS